MALETYWIQTYKPTYNILLEAGNFLGYTHSEEVKQKMKDIYSDERRKRVSLINKNKTLSDSVKARAPQAPLQGAAQPPLALIREKALSRSDEVKNKYRLARRGEAPKKRKPPLGQEKVLTFLAPPCICRCAADASSKPVTLYNENGSVYIKFEGIRLMVKHFGCDHKTINKYIKSGEIFKKQWYIKLDQLPYNYMKVL